MKKAIMRRRLAKANKTTPVQSETDFTKEMVARITNCLNNGINARVKLAELGQIVTKKEREGRNLKKFLISLGFGIETLKGTEDWVIFGHKKSKSSKRKVKLGQPKPKVVADPRSTIAMASSQAEPISISLNEQEAVLLQMRQREAQRGSAWSTKATVALLSSPLPPTVAMSNVSLHPLNPPTQELYSSSEAVMDLPPPGFTPVDTMANVWDCPSCFSTNTSNQNFCPTCGVKKMILEPMPLAPKETTTWTCTSCFRCNMNHQKFCPSCGGSKDAAPVAAAPFNPPPLGPPTLGVGGPASMSNFSTSPLSSLNSVFSDPPAPQQYQWGSNSSTLATSNTIGGNMGNSGNSGNSSNRVSMGQKVKMRQLEKKILEEKIAMAAAAAMKVAQRGEKPPYHRSQEHSRHPQPQHGHQHAQHRQPPQQPQHQYRDQYENQYKDQQYKDQQYNDQQYNDQYYNPPPQQNRQRSDQHRYRQQTTNSPPRTGSLMSKYSKW